MMRLMQSRVTLDRWRQLWSKSMAKSGLRYYGSAATEQPNP